MLRSKFLMKHRLEYWTLASVMMVLRLMPRPLARGLAISLAILTYGLHGRLRRVGMRNLELAFPNLPEGERERILRGVYVSLGRLLAEVPKFPTYTRENVGSVAVHDGLENFLEAEARGKGVLFLTAHMGGWEIGSFVHAMHGHPLQIVMRRLDNPYIDRIARSLRTMHGNQVIDKDEFARGVLGALRRGETVGVLMDTNMTPPEGIFVPFFGIPASTTSSIARLAQKTGAAVVPVFTIFDRKLGKYRIHFEPALETVCTGDDVADAEANTARYNQVIEAAIRRDPDQWLWVHRRWKTRPDGQPSLY